MEGEEKRREELGIMATNGGSGAGRVAKIRCFTKNKWDWVDGNHVGGVGHSGSVWTTER